MAAVCREALLNHLQKPALDLPLPPRADTASPAWSLLKRDVHDYLGREEYQETLEELDSFLTVPSFQPEHTPDLFYRTERPRLKYVKSYAQTRPRMDDYGTRWLDELWA